MNRAFETHLTAVSQGAVTKTNVIGLRKALNLEARLSNGWSVRKTAKPVTEEQFDRFWALLKKHRPVVTGELHETGVKQITARRYRKQLSAYVDVLDDIQVFRLIGFKAIGRRDEHFIPIYEAVNSKGKRMPFVNIPWQSGGKGPEIVY